MVYEPDVIATTRGATLPQRHETNWLIWDGGCAFCGKAVTWFGRLDRERIFTIVPFEQCPSPPMTPALRQAAERAIQIVMADGRRYSGGRAVLFALAEVGWHRTLMRRLANPPFVWLVEGGYRIVANNRNFFSRVVFQRCS